jgi:hypothetical protein
VATGRNHGLQNLNSDRARDASVRDGARHENLSRLSRNFGFDKLNLRER